MLIVILCRVLHLRLKDDAVPLSKIISHNTTDKVSLWRRLSIIDLNHYIWKYLPGCSIEWSVCVRQILGELVEDVDVALVSKLYCQS